MTIAQGSDLPLDRKAWADCMARVQSGDKLAFATLFKFFAPRIKHFTLKKSGNEQLAMELVQETMAIVWQKGHLFDPAKSSLSTWIYTIARNQLFDMLRKQKGREAVVLAQDIWPGDSSAADLLDHYSPEQNMLKEQVVRFLDVLPENQRHVVKAVYLDEMPQQEVAKMLSIPLGTVKSRLRLAVEKLKQTIEAERL